MYHNAIFELQKWTFRLKQCPAALTSPIYYFKGKLNMYFLKRCHTNEGRLHTFINFEPCFAMRTVFITFIILSIFHNHYPYDKCVERITILFATDQNTTTLLIINWESVYSFWHHVSHRWWIVNRRHAKITAEIFALSCSCMYIYTCIYIYTYRWNVFKTTRPFWNLRFRVSTIQANANKPFMVSNMKPTTGGGHLEIHIYIYLDLWAMHLWSYGSYTTLSNKHRNEAYYIFSFTYISKKALFYCNMMLIAYNALVDGI